MTGRAKVTCCGIAICICIHIYIYIHIFTYTYVFIHIHIWWLSEIEAMSQHGMIGVCDYEVTISKRLRSLWNSRTGVKLRLNTSALLWFVRHTIRLCSQPANHARSRSWTGLVNDYADSAFSSIFQAIGDRPGPQPALCRSRCFDLRHLRLLRHWLDQVDFIFVLDAGIKESVLQMSSSQARKLLICKGVLSQTRAQGCA